MTRFADGSGCRRTCRRRLKRSILADEWAALMPGACYRDLGTPLGITIEYQYPPCAEACFLARFKELAW
jgi:hypothetical protein